MSSFVLAIHPAIKTFGSHDPSAALFRAGELVFAIEEERLTRRKHAVNTFPQQSIEACLKHGELELADLDKVVIPWRQRLYSRAFLGTLRQAAGTRGSLNSKLYRVGQATKSTVVASQFSISLIEERLKDIGTPIPRIETIAHHRCHAASALHPAPFDEGLVLTLDGRGEYDSTVVWHADGDDLERIRTYRHPNSLGLFFGAVTKFLGYRPHNGEGKVMGLAPYGSGNENIEAQFREVVTTGVDYDFTAITRGGFEGGVKRMESLFGRPRHDDESEFNQWERDFAYVAQSLLEETVLDIVDQYCREFDTGNVGLAGGVALNCKMNRRVMEHELVEELFVQPVANDAGTVLGAGSLASGADSFEMRTVYWGPEYTTGEGRKLLEQNKIDYTEPENLERDVAQRLADGEIVGWFQGRLELGPRALGNRSILADPRTEQSRDRVNRYVKHREEWRPFAPSILEEAAEDYLLHSEQSPYMIKTFQVDPSKRDEIRAVLHPGDDTTRPQTVREEQNPRYYRLIREFKEITGVPVVLNTSLNDHGEPIVNMPNEAIKDFFGMGLDVLVIEDLLVEKSPDHER